PHTSPHSLHDALPILPIHKRTGGQSMTRYVALVLSIIVCLPACFAGAQDLSKVEIKSSPVAGSVYMLQGSGGNIGVSVGADGIQDRKSTRLNSSHVSI